MPLATVPNIGVLSLDCGSTFQPLMKAQCDVAEESSSEDSVPASPSGTDCLILSATSNLHQSRPESQSPRRSRNVYVWLCTGRLTESQLEHLDL